MNPLGKFAFLGEKSERRKKSSRTTKVLTNVYKPVKVLADRVSHNFSQFIRKSDIEAGGSIEDFEWVGNNLRHRPKPHITRLLLLNCKGLPRNDTDFSILSYDQL